MEKIIQIIMALVLTSTLIINGEPIEGGLQVLSRKLYPFMAALRHTTKTPPDSHFCGGSIIDKRLILTAAHCIRNENPKKVVVVVGTIDRLEVDESFMYEIENWAWHVEYNSVKKDSVKDVALIRVKRDIDFSTDFVKPIPLDLKNMTRVNEDVVLIGFGRKGSNCTQSTKYLHSIVSTIVDIKWYVRDFPQYNPKDDLVICTYCMKKNKYEADESKFFTACTGDSGGPVVIADPNDHEWILVGVISIGDKHFVQAAKVYSLLKWIDELKIKLTLSKLEKSWRGTKNVT